jgi:alpha-D-ribose 1-methylphosphonate 5-triphosphate synthase subunit PhnG
VQHAQYDATDRSNRFELIAACDGDTLAACADDVLDGTTPLRIRQEPKPQLVMQQVTEPVERQPFNLAEVLVTAAEVEVGDTDGFAMVAGKAERKALAGAIVDAAIAGGYAPTDGFIDRLEAGAAEREERRRQQWAESRATTVEFATMEDEA